MAQKPIVCFVTPTKDTAKSVKAFKNHIDDLQGAGNIDWKPFGANGNNSLLNGLAKNARDYVASNVGNPPVPAVIVAGGTLAAYWVQYYTTTIPIVQAAGGSKPSNVGANMTGFYLNAPGAKTICQEQYDRLSPTTAARAAVLYDRTNDNANQDILKSLTDYATPGTLNVVDINGDLAGKLTADALKGIDATHPDQCTSFMLIPNALFYDKCDVIAKAVEDANIQNAIYPEREYKNAHSKQKINGKKVHGHKISLTFGLAAYYVDSLLNDPSCIGTLPWQEASGDEEA